MSSSRLRLGGNVGEIARRARRGKGLGGEKENDVYSRLHEWSSFLLLVNMAEKDGKKVLPRRGTEDRPC